MKKYWIFIVIMGLMASCGKGIPSDIIQPKQMESLLYDYHLAVGVSSSQKNAEKEACRKYVFNKHRVSEEKFDSSMVWYTREAQELSAIYERLEKRFEREHSHVEKLLASRGGEKISITLPGDTVNIWRESDFYWLSEAPLMNLTSFDFKTDTNFRAKDAFLWNADFHFLSEGKAVMGLNVVYDNDSVAGEVKWITESGKYSIYLSNDSTCRMVAMNGFFYVPQDSLQEPMLLINNLELTRYHRNDPEMSSENLALEKDEKLRQ